MLFQVLSAASMSRKRHESVMNGKGLPLKGRFCGRGSSCPEGTTLVSIVSVVSVVSVLTKPTRKSGVEWSSVSDTFGAFRRLAPTVECRFIEHVAHPPPTQPRATTSRTAPLPRSSVHRAVAWRWGGVPRYVVARGGWVDVGGPCGCQTSRRTLETIDPKILPMALARCVNIQYPFSNS